MKRSPRILLSLALLALLALSLPAGATVARFLSLEEHVALAPAIVRGRVAGSKSFVSDKDGRPRTDHTIKVIETFKGPIGPGQELAVRQMRGPVGEAELRIPGDPQLAEGEEVVLFLNLGQDGVAYLAALAQSKYAVSRDRSGAWVSRDFEGLAFTFGDDGRVMEPAKESAISLELFTASIRALAGAR